MQSEDLQHLGSSAPDFFKKIILLSFKKSLKSCICLYFLPGFGEKGVLFWAIEKNSGCTCSKKKLIF
jgi:hypothetical protein